MKNNGLGHWCYPLPVNKDYVPSGLDVQHVLGMINEVLASPGVMIEALAQADKDSRRDIGRLKKLFTALQDREKPSKCDPLTFKIYYFDPSLVKPLDLVRPTVEAVMKMLSSNSTYWEPNNDVYTVKTPQRTKRRRDSLVLRRINTRNTRYVPYTPNKIRHENNNKDNKQQNRQTQRSWSRWLLTTFTKFLVCSETPISSSSSLVYTTSNYGMWSNFYQPGWSSNLITSTSTSTSTGAITESNNDITTKEQLSNDTIPIWSSSSCNLEEQEKFLQANQQIFVTAEPYVNIASASYFKLWFPRYDTIKKNKKKKKTK
jgi:hypothetical protein